MNYCTRISDPCEHFPCANQVRFAAICKLNYPLVTFQINNLENLKCFAYLLEPRRLVYMQMRNL